MTDNTNEKGRPFDEPNAFNQNRLGDVVMICGSKININTVTHLNSSNRKRDTLCGKNFSFPESDTEPVKYEDAVVKINGKAILESNFCSKCLEIFRKNNLT